MANRAQPFCRGLEKSDAGRARCAMCDQNRFLEARRGEEAVRYRCHAGLREFIVPVIRHGEVLALLQCSQVHDRPPTPTEWRDAHNAGLGADALQSRIAHVSVEIPDAGKIELRTGRGRTGTCKVKRQTNHC